MRPTILFVHPSDDRYGADAMLEHSAHAAARTGFRVVVAVPGRASGLAARLPFATMLAVDVPVLRQDLQRTPLGIPRFLLHSAAAIIRLVRIIRGCDAALVLVNTTTIPAWVMAARLAHRPVVVHVHELESDRPRWLKSLLYAPLLLATRILVPSYAVRETITTTYKTLSRRVHVLHNPVRVPPILPEPSPFGTTLQILMVGRLSRRKGQHVALEAIRRLHDRGIDARLTVVGAEFGAGRPYTKKLKTIIATAGLRDRVELLGHRDDVSTFYAAHDAVVMPSTRPESLGLVALEGAAHARPVVASAAGGLREVVQDGRTGYLVQPGDPGALADRLAALARDPQAARVMGERGWRLVQRNFGIAQYQDGLAAMLREVVVKSCHSRVAALL